MNCRLGVLLLAALPLDGQPFTVATVGDSFADSLYNSMRARPDRVREHGVRLVRWSRPIVGLTRTDYFDYVGWLRDSDLVAADLCFVEIGANDMQSIPVAPRQWIPYGSEAWKTAYADRTSEMARILAGRRCAQVIWVLQPGFEKRQRMACHGGLINEVQGPAVRLDRTRLLELVTSQADYAADQTHFNRAYLLELGPALFQLVDGARQIAHGRCLACHRNVEKPGFETAPVRWASQEGNERPICAIDSRERTRRPTRKTRPTRLRRVAARSVHRFSEVRHGVGLKAER